MIRYGTIYGISALLLLISGSFSFAKTSTDQDALDVYNDFVMTVKVFDEFEKRDGVYTHHAENKLFELLLNSAQAAPGKDGSDCMLAGYFGKVKQGSCKPVDGQSIFDSKNNLICNPKVFGPGVVISRPKDSRWTVACANEVIKRSGLADKSIDENFSNEDAIKLGKYLRDTQGVSFANNINFESILGNCKKFSINAKDKSDCDRTVSIFSSALTGYIPKVQPEVQKGYEACWKEWVKTGAKFTSKKAVDLQEGFIQGPGFDSLIKASWLGDCKMKSVEGVESKLKLKGCRVKASSQMSVKSFKSPNEFTLASTLVCEKQTDGSTIENPADVILKCDTGGLSKVDFWMIRMMSRNFNLQPACKSDIRSPSEINADEEKSKKAR